jgi:hypothetical protein
MKIKCFNHYFCDKCSATTLLPRRYELCEECDKILNNQETDLEKFIKLVDGWGLMNDVRQHVRNQHKRPYVFSCDETQTYSINFLSEAWVFDWNENFLFIENVEYDDYLHRGGDLKSFSGREHLYED